MRWPNWLLKELQKKTKSANLGPPAFGIGPNPASIFLTSTTLAALSRLGAERRCRYFIRLLNLTLGRDTPSIPLCLTLLIYMVPSDT